jgi:hypothetical protein
LPTGRRNTCPAFSATLLGSTVQCATVPGKSRTAATHLFPTSKLVTPGQSKNMFFQAFPLTILPGAWMPDRPRGRARRQEHGPAKRSKGICAGAPTSRRLRAWQIVDVQPHQSTRANLRSKTQTRSPTGAPLRARSHTPASWRVHCSNSTCSRPVNRQRHYLPRRGNLNLLCFENLRQFAIRARLPLLIPQSPINNWQSTIFHTYSYLITPKNELRCTIFSVLCQYSIQMRPPRHLRPSACRRWGLRLASCRLNE